MLQGGNVQVRTKKFAIGLTGALVASSLVLAACGGSSANTTPAPAGSGSSSAAVPVVGGEVVIRVPSDPDTMAPFWITSVYASHVTNRIYGDGLLTIDYDLKPAPALAEALPEIGPDQKTYTFKLRKGIKFHDGKEVKAEDIVFAYEILMDKDYAGPAKSIVAPLESVKAIDEYTIEFKTKDVFAPFMYGTATVFPLPKHLLKDIPIKELASNDFWKSKPIGAGPFKFVEWKSGQHVLLERNAEYYAKDETRAKGGKVGPFIEKIRYKVIPEDPTAIAALEAGEITYLDRLEGDNVNRLKQDFADRLNAYEWDRMGYGFQQFNNQNWPTDIKEVRQALSHALDEKAILAGLMDNQGSVPPGFVPPIHWVFDNTVKGYEHDPKKAEELLQKAGFKKGASGFYEKDGKVLKIKYVGSKGSPLVEGIALQSKKDWNAIGIDVELIMVDFNTQLDKHLKPGDFHVSFGGLTFAVDPHFSFDGFTSKNIRLDAKGVNQGSNRSRYSNPQVDDLVEKAGKTLDLEQRKKLYQEAQRLIIDDAASNWVYVNRYHDFATKKLNAINQQGYGLTLQFTDQWFLSAK